MLRGFRQIVIKEVKELLRDPKLLIGMIIFPAIMFPIMGSVMSVSIQSAQEAVLKAPVCLLDLDKGDISTQLKAFLMVSPNLTLIEIETDNITKAIIESQKANASALVVIPKGFSENITKGSKGTIEIYSFIRGTSIAETMGGKRVDVLIKLFQEILSTEIISKYADINPDVVLHPLTTKYKSVFKGKIAEVPPELLMGVLMSQSMTPMIVMIIIVVAMSIAASSIAIEKEMKTLETLLTLPVSRMSILTGKLVGAIVVGLLGAISYMIGFSFYAESTMFAEGIPQAPQEILSELGLVMGPDKLLILGISVFLSIIAALALALTVAVFTEDVRSAQSIVGFLYFIVFIPAMMLMYTDIKMLPTQIQYVLYAIPFTYPALTAKAVLIEDYSTITLGIVYTCIFTLVVLYIAARLFTTEKILTARISFKKRRTSEFS